MKTYTYGTTPNAAILAALPDRYQMSLVSSTARTLERIVNQGIDSHLEAVVESSFNWDIRDGGIPIGELNCGISRNNMLVILRRLLEDGSDDAMELRSSILTTLDIEEV